MNTLATISLKHIKDILSDNQLPHISMENNEEIISRLKFIGHIQKDEKIDVRHVSRQPNNLLTKVYRTVVYPDNRTNSLKFIRDVINRSFEIIMSWLLGRRPLITKCAPVPRAPDPAYASSSDDHSLKPP